jgi:adenine-specific DNA glycosylase
MFFGLSRYFDVETDIAQSLKFAAGFRSHAKDIPAIFNQALWDFGAAMCS